MGWSELWVQKADGWRQRIVPGADAPPLPDGWPTPLESYPVVLDELQIQLLRRAEVLAAGVPSGGGGERVAPGPTRR
jgi:hypothetical protein